MDSSTAQRCTLTPPSHRPRTLRSPRAPTPSAARSTVTSECCASSGRWMPRPPASYTASATSASCCARSAALRSPPAPPPAPPSSASSRGVNHRLQQGGAGKGRGECVIQVCQTPLCLHAASLHPRSSLNQANAPISITHPPAPTSTHQHPPVEHFGHHVANTFLGVARPHQYVLAGVWGGGRGRGVGQAGRVRTTSRRSGKFGSRGGDAKLRSLSKQCAPPHCETPLSTVPTQCI